ncbi:WbuC family cupin fold metalloprotein [Shewanella intestini]|uniref:WbuC family cupin fold metalloprotein n=1 Tax=Shewanella intestini TaxID=2017544 RepID=A0ABS5I2J0_9GAMM|nr:MULTISPECIES: WbuC family cupin fold metalloprotein [Shewanella]MBR9728246.1 WbuC family cupin fold metalloprotein [Shewanella intestini]MRG35711.1 cupin fold metalloprotein, WbuC family [Shewanella sp. XMDDZSB0408]
MLKIISNDDFKQFSQNAQNAPRHRSHHNLHDTLDAGVQRLFISTEPDTYMRPHRHSEAHKWELFLVLKGQLDLLIFNEQGQVTARHSLSPDTNRAIEIPPNTWHGYACMQSGTVGLEIKEGAYIPTPKEDFAAWSPAEGESGADDYRNWMRSAQVNDAF